MKTLFCIIGRSATGKDTLTNDMCEKLNMTKVISHTTRMPRTGEKDGINYYFSSEDDYFQTAAKDICAYTQIGENYYWTTYGEILDKDFYVIDPRGLKSLRKSLRHKPVRIITIYITAPEKSRHSRALLRDRSRFDAYTNKCVEENLQFSDYEETKEYDYCIHNVHFQTSLKQLETIIKEEKENIYAI